MFEYCNNRYTTTVQRPSVENKILNNRSTYHESCSIARIPYRRSVISLQDFKRIAQ